MAFHNGVTASPDKGRAMDIIYLDFCKAFYTVTQNILAPKLASYVFDECRAPMPCRETWGFCLFFCWGLGTHLLLSRKHQGYAGRCWDLGSALLPFREPVALCRALSEPSRGHAALQSAPGLLPDFAGVKTSLWGSPGPLSGFAGIWAETYCTPESPWAFTEL